MDDGRDVNIIFFSDGQTTRVTETFVTESTHPVEVQKEGWQGILENFRKHVESL